MLLELNEEIISQTNRTKIRPTIRNVSKDVLNSFTELQQIEHE